MRCCLIASVVFAAGLTPWIGTSGALPVADDESEIRALLEDFVVGWRGADTAGLERVFATELGTVMWVSHGGDQDDQDVLQSITFAEALDGRRPQPEYGLEWEVAGLDIVDGNLAVGKLDIADGDDRVVDFMTLYKIGDQWRIVNNTFVFQPGGDAGASDPDRVERDADAAELRRVLEDYVVGWREGDADQLADVFATEVGTIMWVGDHDGEPTLQAMTFDAALQRRRQQPSYGLEWEVLSLDVVDDEAAVAKLYISGAGGSYIDFLALYKIAGRWRIVNKTFSWRSGPRESV